jgi:hypothetical protein
MSNTDPNKKLQWMSNTDPNKKQQWISNKDPNKKHSFATFLFKVGGGGHAPLPEPNTSADICNNPNLLIFW